MLSAVLGVITATHNTFRQIGSTLGVTALGVIVTAGQHATAGALAAFGSGLSRAITVVATMLVTCAVIVAVPGDRQSRARKKATEYYTVTSRSSS
jgi:hypothetical protein